MSRPAEQCGAAGIARLLVVAAAVGVFIGTLDQTVVVTILPRIIDDLGLPVSRFGEATWIINGYLLGYTLSLPVLGNLADAFGHVRLYLACLLIFVLGSALVALAPNLPALAVARSFQAIGGGGVLPVATAIAADVLAPRRRPLAFGSLAAANNGSSLLGPLWGAALVGLAGWRGIFWLNIPLILPVAGVLLWTQRRAATSSAHLHPEPRRRAEPVEGPAPLPRGGRGSPEPGGRRALDLSGAALLAVTLACATVALTDDGANPRPLWLSLGFGLIAIVAACLFLRRERRTRTPLLRFQSVREPHLLAALGMYFLIGGALIVALVDVPLMRNVLFHGSALQGGLDLMRLLLLLPAGGVVGGVLCTRAGYRPTAAIGLLLAIGGFLAMRFWSGQPSSGQLWLALGLIGFGLGLCDAPIVSTVIDAAHASERAAASALLLVLWTCGMITGLGLLGTQGLSSFSVRAARLFREQGLNLDTAAIDRLMRQTFDATFVGAALALALALLLTVFLARGKSASVRWNPVAGLDE